jgi:hypothetical protein
MVARAGRLLARSMTGSKIKNIAKGAKAAIHKGDEGRSGGTSHAFSGKK